MGSKKKQPEEKIIHEPTPLPSSFGEDLANEPERGKAKKLATFGYLDTETAPTLDPKTRQAIEESVVIPSSYKKPESIADWYANVKPSLVEKELLKTSLSGGLGRLVVLAFAFDNEEPIVLSREVLIDGFTSAGLKEDALREKAMLEDFFSIVAGINPAYWVGFNIGEFDLNFLWKRSIVLGADTHGFNFHQRKRYDDAVIDLRPWWFSYHPQKGETLDEMCRQLGIEIDDSITGADVWERLKLGDVDAVVDHCVADIHRTREAHIKLNAI